MRKNEVIQLLNSEGWTKADAKRAIALIDFKTDPSEIVIRRAVSKFAGTELINRQRSQAVQKGLVIKKINEIKQYLIEIENLKKNTSISDPDLAKKLKQLSDKNIELQEANQKLKKDNKDLKNIVDAIRLKLTIEIKHLLEYNSVTEIKKSLVKLLNSTLG